MAISTRMPLSPVTPSAQSPSTGARPSSSRPSSAKNSMAASRSSTTMPTLSMRLTVMMSPWRFSGAIEKGRRCAPLDGPAGASDDVEVLDALVEVLVLRALAVQLDVEAHLVGGVGEAQRVLVADPVGLEEVEQRLVEGLHAELARLLHDLLDAVDLALEDQVRDQRRVQEHLHRG